MLPVTLLKTVVYSILGSLVFGVMDPAISALVLAKAPRGRPLYYVLAARAGALLPDSLRLPPASHWRRSQS